MAEQWTIQELSDRVGRALVAGGWDRQVSGRVRAVPDTRTIRYYTTVGLLDRPESMRGRTALYGHRHLLQLVAIKRLQSSGVTLTEVQESLLGADDNQLAQLAGIGPDWRDQPAEAEPRSAKPEPGLAGEVEGAEAPMSAPVVDTPRDVFWAASTAPPIFRAAREPQPLPAVSQVPTAACCWTVAPGVRLTWEGLAGEMLAPIAEELDAVLSNLSDLVDRTSRSQQAPASDDLDDEPAEP